MEQIGAVLVAFLLGLWGYYHRADLERRRKLYVEDGIDAIIDDVEYVFGTYAQNWQLALRALKTFREIPEFLSERLLDQFVEIDHSRMSMASARRVSRLVGSDSIWSFYQLCFTFSGTRSQIILYELVPALVSNVGADEAQRVKICEVAESELKKMDREFHLHYEVLNHLCAIKDELDDVRFFSQATVRDLEHRCSVRRAVSMIEGFVETRGDDEADDQALAASETGRE